MAELTFFEFLVALCMGLGAFSFFLWALLSGAFKDVEAIKHQVTRVEAEDHE